jgi:hypothetical protein
VKIGSVASLDFDGAAGIAPQYGISEGMTETGETGVEEVVKEE